MIPGGRSMTDDAAGHGRLSMVRPVESGPSRWLVAMVPSLYRSWRERAWARQTSRAALQLYREVQVTRPELEGVTRYQEVLARHTGLDEQRVRKIIAGAENSFAIWPVERELRFRDVVQYLVVYQCLEAEPRVLGTRTQLTTIIEEEIPDSY